MVPAADGGQILHHADDAMRVMAAKVGLNQTKRDALGLLPAHPRRLKKSRRKGS
jgi:hypothetical protein